DDTAGGLTGMGMSARQLRCPWHECGSGNCSRARATGGRPCGSATPWSTSFAVSSASTLRGRPWAFQATDPPIRTTNAVVDWWLVLFPGGIEWQALDERSAAFMVGPERCQPGSYLGVLAGIYRGLRPLVTARGSDPLAWGERLAGMPA